MEAEGLDDDVTGNGNRAAGEEANGEFVVTLFFGNRAEVVELVLRRTEHHFQGLVAREILDVDGRTYHQDMVQQRSR